MGFFDNLKSKFTGHHHRVQIGDPLTVRSAKQTLSRILLQEPLEDMRKTANAVHEMESQTPEFVTYTMSHYYSSPRLVRFQSSGGKQMDVDAIGALYSSPGVLQDECAIQHLMGDIDDLRGHMTADEIGKVSVDELAARTSKVIDNAGSLRDPALRNWLLAIHDQLGDIIEATGGKVQPLIDMLNTSLALRETSCGERTPGEADAAGTKKGASGDAAGATGGDTAGGTVRADSVSDDTSNATNANPSADPKATLAAIIVKALYPDANPPIRAAMLDDSATTDAYMRSIEILKSQGLAIPGLD
jgi:hypothetical protein